MVPGRSSLFRTSDRVPRLTNYAPFTSSLSSRSSFEFAYYFSSSPTSLLALYGRTRSRRQRDCGGLTTHRSHPIRFVTEIRVTLVLARFGLHLTAEPFGPKTGFGPRTVCGPENADRSVPSKAHTVTRRKTSG